MSRPRFVVSEVSGYATLTGGGGHTVLGLTVSVLDRVYCYRVVQKWQTETERQKVATYLRGCDRLRAHIRAQAHALAPRLNREYGAVA